MLVGFLGFLAILRPGAGRHRGVRDRSRHMDLRTIECLLDAIKQPGFSTSSIKHPATSGQIQKDSRRSVGRRDRCESKALLREPTQIDLVTIGRGRHDQHAPFVGKLLPTALRR